MSSTVKCPETNTLRLGRVFGHYGGEMWINDRHGLFAALAQRPGPLPSAVDLGDLDSDGDIDAFVVNARLAYFVGDEDDRIEVWLNGNQPTSGDQTYFALEDGGPILVGPADGLLRNATDADGDALSVETTHWVEEKGTLGYLWRVFGLVETRLMVSSLKPSDRLSGCTLLGVVT